MFYVVKKNNNVFCVMKVCLFWLHACICSKEQLDRWALPGLLTSVTHTQTKQGGQMGSLPLFFSQFSAL